MSVNLRSDNVAGAAPEIIAAVLAANQGASASYGGDALTEGLSARMSALFGRDCFVQPMLTGTATNALSLSLLTPAWGGILCSETAHVHDSECGAVEALTGGAKITTLPHEAGRIDPEVLAQTLARVKWGNTSVAPPKVLSVAQATELGTVYQPDHLAALSKAAKAHGLRVHLDGARLGNAIASLGCSPAEMARHVDVISFGGTKNGALCAEAVVCFDPTLAEELRYRARKMGQVASKMRFISAQLHALLDEDRWLSFAGHANAMARRLTEGLTKLPGVQLLYPVEANEIFMILPDRVRAGLTADGYGFYDRGAGEVRMVTAFSTRAEDVDGFIASAERAAGAKGGSA